MKKTVFLCTTLMLCLGCSAQQTTVPLTVKVLDDNGQPCSGAEVRVGFSQNRMNDPSKVHRGFAETNGVFSVIDSGDGGVGVAVYKEGYYDWHDRYLFYAHAHTGEMMPFNSSEKPISVLLKKIESPSPMYVKEVELAFPEEGVPLGFDLERGDWIQPYGLGVNADLLLTAKRLIIDKDNFESEIKVLLSNEHDGLLELSESEIIRNSSFPLPRYAPEIGYKTEWYRQINKSSGARSYIPNKPNEKTGFVFRVRTEMDENGEIIQANYGKIDGDFRFVGQMADKMSVIFTYYFNPVLNDRNLEFDPKRNLFADDRRIYAP